MEIRYSLGDSEKKVLKKNHIVLLLNNLCVYANIANISFSPIFGFLKVYARTFQSRMRHVVCHVDYIEVPWYLQHHHFKPFILQRHTFVQHIWQMRLTMPQYSCLLVPSSSCLYSWINQERLEVAVVQYFSCLLLLYSLLYHNQIDFCVEKQEML